MGSSTSIVASSAVGIPCMVAQDGALLDDCGLPISFGPHPAGTKSSQAESITEMASLKNGP